MFTPASLSLRSGTIPPVKTTPSTVAHVCLSSYQPHKRVLHNRSKARKEIEVDTFFEQPLQSVIPFFLHPS